MRMNYFRIFLLTVSALVFVAGAAAQDAKPPDGQPQDGGRPNSNQPQDVRTNVLRQLGLSPDQVQQIRRMNQERKPLMDAAQRRFREANQALDEAIYADQVNEVDIQGRLKEVQLAQAEVARVRYMNELSVRKILTPEQLTRFRDLRQRFEQVRERIKDRAPDAAMPNDRRPNGGGRFQPQRQQPQPAVATPVKDKPNP